ncbi:thioesterase family protein [Pseudohaliea rubra]|uniref:TesB-like acyl-CoA thioesterase 3 n=1 Tax=Pseudohaliea rubra DSM 19751 TaxID=1265313 RepID=A0A095VNF4_9GAMM|nr:thioesterase family protein [Pseudohaliea rubra]KGE03002.1 TesB-like acyl-CoA thioesterase 3 [Pseudohaliea rubra DSM 19751]
MGFHADTAVEAVADGRYGATLQEGWDVVGNANGGYLLAIAARAMMAASGRPHPVTLSAHFLSPGRPGPLTIDCETIKEGRRFATLSATLASAERPLLRLLGGFADLGALEGPARIEEQPPELPPPDECPRVRAAPEGFPPAMMDRIDLRLHPEDAGFKAGRPSGRPLFRGWFRLLDEEPLDACALLLALDAFPPTIFNANLPVSWTPTVELTAHLRAIPAPGWLRCRFSTRFIAGGLMEEDGELWDSEGHFVAQSRQLALVPRGG